MKCYLCYNLEYAVSYTSNATKLNFRLKMYMVIRLIFARYTPFQLYYLYGKPLGS